MFKHQATRFGAIAAALLLTLACANARAALTISPAPGYSISWDGNDGDFFTPASPALAPNNVALASNLSTPFGSSQFGVNHLITKINDGNYGNQDSWIGGDPTPSIGVAFPALTNLTSIAWGRDNGNNFEGVLTDRSIGTYTLRRTTVAAPGAGTPVTGTAATGWETIGTLTYQPGGDGVVGNHFTPHLRHEFDINLGGSAVPATAIRIDVAPNSLAIDEIEAYAGSVAKPLTLLETGPEFSSVPNNLANAPGAIAFAQNVINGGGFASHQIAHLNDSTYGNSNSWIGSTNASFAGIDLGDSFRIDAIAFGRSNDPTNDPCAGGCKDRSIGTYILQYTTVPNPDETTPDSDWINLGALAFDGAFPDATPWLRHKWGFDPVMATGVRILADTGAGQAALAIDEIEVFAHIPEPTTAALTLLGLLGVAARRRRNQRQA